MNRNEPVVSAEIFKTPVCSVLAVFSSEVLCEVFVNPGAGIVSRYRKYLGKNARPVESVRRFLEAYAEGRNYSLPKFDFEGYSPNERKVLETLGEIRFGETISYGALALRSGLPGAARFAGSVMKKNRFPLILPCHRVIRFDGSIGEYSSGGPAMKKKLLDFELSKKG